MRRRLLATLAGASAFAALRPHAANASASEGSTGPLGFAELPEGTLDEQTLYRLPGKAALIKKSYRPPNFETPIQYFRSPITPNKAFFVRWHLAQIPTIEPGQWSVKVEGDSAEHELTFNLHQLRHQFDQVEITAVCQCSGNRRGLFEPHVPGVEWGVGAMGNAVWKGVRLKDVLAKAGVKPGAIEVSFNGADAPVLEATPDFIKSLPIEIALDQNTLIAFEMNGEPLPSLNGGPARLVVPGWTGTYWVKQLVNIKISSKPETNFWMTGAYRLPRGKFNTPSFQSQVTAANEPITTMVVNSLLTLPTSGTSLAEGKPIPIYGLAWDRGAGIDRVEISTDFGNSWSRAILGRDLGRFSFREFSLILPARERGGFVVMARATSSSGETQPMELVFNPAGYHHNVIQRLFLEVA